MGTIASRIFASEPKLPQERQASLQTQQEHQRAVVPVVQVSKNALKKQAREQRLRERKEKRKTAKRELKAQKKIQKREERERLLRNVPAEEREKILAERIRIMREGRAMERARRAHVQEILTTRTRFNICIDLGWNEAMYAKERKSLARQLAYSYNALRKCIDDGLTPVRLSICGVDDIIKPVLTIVSNGWESWPLELSGKSLLDTHKAERLVYLTHDADDVLEDMNSDDVYVIGGIVDRNRLKGATIEKAKALGIRTARLNLNDNLTLEHGTPVLTVNHCVEILVCTANGLSWKEAYQKVLPSRKGVILDSGPSVP